MRRFVLVRNEDVTGRSGTGIIGEGVAWTGGPAFLHWVTEYESFVHWPGGIDAILAVHGHEGSTICRWLDDLPEDREALVSEDYYEDDNPLAIFDREDRG